MTTLDRNSIDRYSSEAEKLVFEVANTLCRSPEKKHDTPGIHRTHAHTQNSDEHL
jgi:hypothetical protein